MIVDTSAMLAVLFDEPDAVRYAAAMAAADERVISAASLVETGIVIEAQAGPGGGLDLDDFLERNRFRIEPFTGEQAAVARAAYRQYGKGSRHPARLNLGDCFAYALAKVRGEPLLFKGRDFARTDIEPAL